MANDDLGRMRELLPALRAAVTLSDVRELRPLVSHFTENPRVFGRPRGERGPQNVHAVGLGLRRDARGYRSDELAFKIFLYELPSRAPRALEGRTFQDAPLDFEELPEQMARPPRASARAGAVLPPARRRHDPIPGGVSTSPLGVDYVGTLGCFVMDRKEALYALSNSHVFAEMGKLPVGTPEVQPGPETGATDPTDVYARLSDSVAISFPGPNLYDAAIARLTGARRAALHTMLGIPGYGPGKVVSPVPGMNVVKSGRTTGVTHGRILYTDVDGVDVNYGAPSRPKVARFDNTIIIRSVVSGKPFGLPGDSGSAILEEEGGHPTALLFAGDGTNTIAADFQGVCGHFGVVPR